MKIDAKALLAEVRANLDRLEACPRHQFDAVPAVLLSDKHACLRCGGTMDVVAIGQYARGYKAAGGNPDDIWPGLIP